MRLSDLLVARNVARSLAFHSHSRFDKKSNGEGNMSVFNVDSIWNTLGPLSRMILPRRHTLLCSSLLWRSIRLRVFCRVSGLWWKLRLR